MPTGYTYKVAEQENYSFDEFVWSCARAFGALYHMRDDSMDAKLEMPKRYTHHSESLEQATKELLKYQTMSLKDAAFEATEEMHKNRKYAEEGIAKNLLEHKRYTNMIEQVEAWTPPTVNHRRLKEFMLEQLNSSINFDCNNTYFEEILNRKPGTTEEWLAAKIEGAKHDIEYHTKHQKTDDERYEENVKWINQLMESVPLPKKIAK